MASLGVQAIYDLVTTGTKPTVSEGLDFYNTGVALVTDKPAEGVESITSDDAEAICWGVKQPALLLPLVGRSLSMRPPHARPTLIPPGNGPYLSTTLARSSRGRTRGEADMSEVQSTTVDPAERFLHRPTPIQRIHHVLHRVPGDQPGRGPGHRRASSSAS